MDAVQQQSTCIKTPAIEIRDSIQNLLELRDPRPSKLPISISWSSFAKLGEKTIICDIDFKKVENVRRHWPFFRDRRIDYYKGILNNPKDA